MLQTLLQSTGLLRDPFPLFDDCEDSSGESANQWSFQNGGGPNPDWNWNTTDSFSGLQSMAWTSDGSFAGHTEGVWFWGSRDVSEGRVCVDLANPAVVDPVLRYKMKGSFPEGSGRGMYHFSTWSGWEGIGGWGSDNPDWVDVEVDLSGRIGYSGRFVWWIWGSSGEADGIWLDDIEVTNATPQIFDITPGIAVDGDAVTLTGLGFSSTSISKTLTLALGMVVEAGDIVSWTDQEIVFNVPTGARSGEVIVTVNGISGDPSSLTVRLPAPIIGETGQI